MNKPSRPLARKLAAGQLTRVTVFDVDSGESVVVHENHDVLLEAPNWATDGSALFLNGDGVLWRLDLAMQELSEIKHDALPEINNDHVLSPAGDRIFLSANDHHIYEASLAGGPVRQVTREKARPRMHFLHDVSPDGGLLAYIGLEHNTEGRREANVFLHRLSDGTEFQLTHGERPTDGCEFTPDGEWVYFNTEQFSSLAGHAQLARMRVDGSETTQLTADERVNWFPHIAPDGRRVVYLSYEPGTTGHPADRVVQLRLVEGDDYGAPRVLATLPGGQGTINVNSWAPDSRRFAYVEYPSAHKED